jgi:starch-binding outer membrane protein, SusD/RagB family
MKSIKLKKLISGLVVLTIFAGCDSYLDMTPELDVSERDIFSTFEGTQGFLDKNYILIVDVLAYETGGFPGYGDDFISVTGRIPVAAAGDFWDVIGPSNSWTIFYISRNQFSRINPGDTRGLWPDSWEGIRMANLVLEKLPLMVNATKEEKNLIEGQCYFFRAYHHWTLIKNWGGMPYVDKVLREDNFLPRLTYWQTTDRIVEDLDRAAALLPDNWDETTIGKRNPGRNLGRITKGGALGLKAKALLWAGSPTMVSSSTGGAPEFDQDYMKRAAIAAYDVIKLADAGVHRLVPWAEYYQQFARIDGFQPWSSETLVACVNDAKGYNFGNGGPGGPANGFGPDFSGVGMEFFNQKVGRNLTPARFAGTNITAGVTQNLVDMFETINGLPIEDPESGYDPMDPWNNRDPRFRGGILVDQDEWTFTDPEIYKLNMYVGGGDTGSEYASPYICKKFWPKGANNYDNMGAQYRLSNPNVRLAEIYLIYAEAVNEVWGPTGRAPDASISAVDAVNIIRARADMPGVHSKFLGNKDDFRERIWNERAVELFAEDGTRWYDIKRWNVAHLEKYRKVYTLLFDREYTFFNKVEYQTKVFEQKHYWLPIYRKQTQIYPEFQQNPGW